MLSDMPSRPTVSAWGAGRFGWLVLPLAAAALAVALCPGVARAGLSSAQEVEPGISVALKAQPFFYRAGDRLAIKVRITNHSTVPLEGFGLQISAFDRVTSRSALHQSFEAPSGTFTSFPRTFDDRVDAGSSMVVRVNDRISELASLDQATDSGVYPMTISLVDQAGVTLDSFTTELIYYPGRVDTPLNLALVVPFNATPARGPHGGFDFESAAAGAGGGSLVEGLAPSGWLSYTLETLDELTSRDLQVAVAPTPRLIEELADLRDGYQLVQEAGLRQIPESPTSERAAAFLDGLRELLQRDGVQPLLAPYSLPDLPGLEEHAEGDIGYQLTHGQDVLRTSLGLDVGKSWVFPPAGRVNADTIEALKQAGVDHLFFSAGSVEDPVNPVAAGCPEQALSFACPVAVDSPLGGTTRGYVADAGVQERLVALASSGNDRLELQRLLAETAVIREELPGRSDRIVNASVPARWQPSRRTTRLLYRGLATAPWLETVTPEAGLMQGIEVAEREAVDSLPEPPNHLTAENFDDIAGAGELVQSFSEMEPPASLLERLQRNILVAESRLWWSDPGVSPAGLEYAASAAREAVAEMQKIDVAINKVVLTSSRGKVLLSVENSADYPVRIQVRLDSLKLAPDPPLIEARFDKGLTREFVDVTAQATGIFSLEVTVTTPGEGYRIQQLSRPVRSTEFNRIALGITIGALLFLIGFYLQRWYKRRHSARSSASGPP
jgi:hypothetical protein